MALGFAICVSSCVGTRAELSGPPSTAQVSPVARTYTIRHPGLFPETLLYRNETHSFVVSSLRLGAVYEVAEGGATRPIVNDPRLCSVLGIALDEARSRLWAVSSDLGVSRKPSPQGPKRHAAVGVYDATTGRPLHYVDLSPLVPGPHLLNGIALDRSGAAYVTDSFTPVIYKVTAEGEASVWLRDPRFIGEGISLNGLVVHPEGYLLVAKKSDGSLFKVPIDHPDQLTAVSMEEAIVGADGVVLMDPQNLVLVANEIPGAATNAALRLVSDDHWSSARIVARTALGSVYPTTAAVRDGRLFAIHSQLNTLIQAEPGEREALRKTATIVELSELWPPAQHESRVQSQSDSPALAPADDSVPAPALIARARQYFSPLTRPPEGSADLVQLGRALFFETRVSADGKTGCVSCHQPEQWGTDGRPRSRGVEGRQTPRNAPTVLNAAGQVSQHWRGERASLADEAIAALTAPPAYGLPRDHAVIERLGALDGYRDAFAKAFPDDPGVSADPIQVERWGLAIAAYLQTLYSPGPIDAFLSGDSAALGVAAQRGLRAFLDLGCAGCHTGSLFGGTLLRRFEPRPAVGPTEEGQVGDRGRYDLTGEPNDAYVFKVPPLRNVSHTAPYFHDGSVDSLPEAIQDMARRQTGQTLAAAVIEDIEAFLVALGGEVPLHFAPPR